MALTLEEFVQSLQDSGIISSEALSEFLPPCAQPKDAEDLAQELVRQRKLTRFQAKEIWLGKGKRLILGNYILLDRIGAGGMGQVYLARHKRMDRTVAIKMLPAAMTSNPAALARFEREVKAAARVSHPNIVAAHDADVADGAPFLVMEYIEGQNLATLVKAEGPLSVSDAVNYLVQTTQGLQFAHKKGIVHRDIKPGNLLLDNEGTIKILDLGLARLEECEPGATELTATGVVVGTVDYMSPEQASGTRHADIRSDIYSLGCTLYFLLTGDTLYGGDGSTEKIVAHREHSIPSLRAERSDVPAELDLIFQRMVAKQPEERFQSTAEVLTRLSELSSSIRSLVECGTVPESAGQRTRRSAADSTVNYVPTAELNARAKDRRRRRIGLACVAVVLLTTVGYGISAYREHAADGNPQQPLALLNPVGPDKVAVTGEHVNELPTTNVASAQRVAPPPPAEWGEPHWVLQGHEGPVYGVAISAEGRWLASGSADRTLRIWDLSTGEQVKKLEGHSGGVRSVSFDERSNQLLSASDDRTLRLWDLDSGSEVGRFEGHRDNVHAAVLGGKRGLALSGSKDQEVILWDTSTFQPIQRYRKHTHPVWAVALHGDGRHLLSAGSDQVVRVWQASEPDEVRVGAGHSAQVMSLAAATETNRFASAGLDGAICIWDDLAAEPALRLTGHKGGVRAISISNNGRYLLSGGIDMQLLLWDIDQQRALYRTTGHAEIIACVALSPDLQFAAAAGGLLQGSDRAIRVWKLPSPVQSPNP